MNDSTVPKKKIIINYILNATYQIFLLIVPLVLTPYVSRTLLADGIGRYSYSCSIIYYFTMFAALGTAMYGQREVAKYQCQLHAQTKVFWETTILRTISATICILLNLFFVALNIYGGYSFLMLILTINIAAVAFDISYFFQGNEKYGKIIMRNVLIKLLGMALIFMFVKTSSDVWKYALINSLTILMSNITLWGYLPQMLCKISLKDITPFKHLKNIIILFIPTITVSIYTMVDKTLIGIILKNDAENGYYEQAEKIVRMCVTVITCLSTVMISRNSIEHSNGNENALKKNIYFASKFVWFLAAPLSFGLAGIASNMNYWFFGAGYEKVTLLILVFCPIILSLGLNNVTGVQYLIATGRDKIFTISVVFGAALNFIMNIILIHIIGTVGAVISSVTAETIILIIQLFLIRKEISFTKILLAGWKNVIAGAIMLIVLLFCYHDLSSTILHTILIIITGSVIYLTLLVLMKDEMISQVLIVLKKRIMHKKSNP